MSMEPSTFALPAADFFAQVRWGVTYFFSSIAFSLGFSLRTEGSARVPTKGPALLIANHQSYLDPVVMGLASRRPLCYLARKTLFKNPIFAWLIRSLNAVPIDQEGVGKEGIKAVLELLRAGRAVVVFPEGNRTEDGKMRALKPGIQLLLKRTEAPVLPVGIAGAYDAWPRQQKWPMPSPLFWPATPRTMAVSVGRPLDSRRLSQLPREQVLDELTRELQNVVARAEKLRRK
jgi:1-acyl-sn-glycerol-3-phosphate acyltransferase